MSMRALTVISIVAVLAMAAASVWAFGIAPQITQIAVHWNMAGEAVAYRSKDVVLIGPPAIALVMSLVFAVIARGAEVRGRALRAMWLAGLLALGAVHVFFVLSAAGYVQAFGNYTALFPAVFLGVIGNYLTKRGFGEESANAPSRRWLGRMLVLTSLATIATWFLLPGTASEFVLIGGGVLLAIVAVLFGGTRREEPHSNGA